MVAQNRLAPWVRKKLEWGLLREIKILLKQYSLNSVCESARCPNRGECFGKGQVTFMIMGNICTRNCTFCSVQKGRPLPLDPQEPFHIAEAAQQLNLNHVVVTSVTRDDLPDGGAYHYARTIMALKQLAEIRSIEVLTSDFGGSFESLRIVLESGPSIFNHNLETVPRLYVKVRPQANYERSLGLLKEAARSHPEIPVKSGLMVGLGERPEEVEKVLTDLKKAGCSMVTIGQYLRPGLSHMPVYEYVNEETFWRYEAFGKRLGFEVMSSSPLVRSSYQAERLMANLRDSDF